MKKYHFSNLERITKTRARKLYNSGNDILFIPCKLNPENDFITWGYGKIKICKVNIRNLKNY